MKILAIILTVILDWIPSGPAWLEPKQQRDSILVADQLDYGFELKDVKEGTQFGLADFSSVSNDTLTIVRNWQIDTLRRRNGRLDLRAHIRIAPFEEGHYELPQMAVLRALPDGKVDSLQFDPTSIDVYSMPVDTATFVINDLKGQMRYPLTFKEILPWILALWLLAAIVVGIVYLVLRRRLKNGVGVAGPKESPYIVALRNLDKLRGNKYWAGEKQKIYYSGITDALKVYIDERFGIDAPEMTTAELFSALKARKELTPDLFERSRELFELADFVKFAKHIASDEENAQALPTAIQFVMTTYQTELEEEQGSKDVL